MTHPTPCQKLAYGVLAAVWAQFIGVTASVLLGFGVLLFLNALLLSMLLQLIAPGRLVRKARREYVVKTDPRLSALIEQRMRDLLSSAE